MSNCSALAFHPTLTATTKGDSSKANGRELHRQGDLLARSGQHCQNQACAADHAARAPDDDRGKLGEQMAKQRARLRAYCSRLHA